MEKILNVSKKQNSQINLSKIYTEKEIEYMKKLFPKLTSLITLTPSNTSKRLSIQSNPKSNQMVEREKFVKLITDKMMNVFKKEDSEILGKSISYILKSDEVSSKKNHRNTDISAKTLKSNYFKNMSEKSKNNGDITLFQRKKIYKKVNFELKTENNNFPRLKKKLDLNVKNINNNTVRSNLGKKYIDLTNNNTSTNYKIKEIKSNSIINNFITFSNTSKPEQIILYEDKSSKNKKSNILNNSSNSNKSNKGNRFSVDNKVMPFNFTYNFLKTENNKARENKNKSSKKKFYSRKSNIDIDKNYSINFIKKIEKIKTEIDLKNRNTGTRSSKRKSDVHKEVKTPVSFINLNDNSSFKKKSLFQMKTSPNLKENKTIDPTNLSSYSSIETKEFDIFNFETKVGKENTLYLIGFYIYKKFDFSKIIKQKKYENWCKKIAAGYSRLNPYHTDLHGADVTQTCFLSLLQENVKEISKMDNIDICSLILSCMCHDYKHFGLNNNFLRLTKHKLAIRYNDISILENMHISETFKLINSNPDCDIFSGVDKTTYEKMRKKMIACVLSTDMFYHSHHIQFMKDLIDKKDLKQEDNQQYMNLLIHAADISNPTKPFNIYLKWAKLVVEEFCQQGDKEKALGLVCTNDRNKIKLSTNQIGFIDYVVEGFVSSFVQIFPSLKFLHDNLVDNRAKFVNYKEDEKSNTSNNKKAIKK